MTPGSVRDDGTNRRCGQCGRTFSKPEHLQRHVRSHTKEKPFTCKSCGKSFARSDVRKRHEKAHASKDGRTGSNRGEPATAPANGLTSPSSTDVGQGPASVPGPQYIVDLEPIAGTDSLTSWTDPLESTISLEDFDFNNLDDFLNDVMIDWVQGTNNSQYYYEPTGLAPPAVQHSRSRTPNSDLGGELQAQFLVDHQYSIDISRQLKPTQQQFDTVYSAEYLTLCLQMYFTHFHPIFPLIHAPTFRPRAYNALVLISMCSIGSLFIGSPEATAQGHQLYSRLNKAILASWETHLSESKRSTLPIIQAALLGQTFGLLSKKSADRFMTECFQGTLIVWARSVGALNMDEEIPRTETLTGAALSNAWTTWARKEEHKRLAIAVYVHDTELACLFQRDPYLRHRFITHPSYSADDIFEASTAEEWQRLYLRQGHSAHGNPSLTISEWVAKSSKEHTEDAMSISIGHSSFAAYASLANIGAYLMEMERSQLPLPTDIENQARGLLKWYRTYLRHAQNHVKDPHCLQVLWHSYSLLLYANVPVLERAVDAQSKEVDLMKAEAWARSPGASCAMLHVCLLQKHASELRLGTVPPIHLPRAVFAAGLVSTAFLRFCSQPKRLNDTRRVDWKQSILSMPGIATIAQKEEQRAEQLASWVCEVITSRLSTLPYSCITLLRKLSHWGVSEVFADSLRGFLRFSSESPDCNSAA